MKKRRLRKKQLDYISDIICKKLEGENLESWKQACKSLAPPNYSITTRVIWFEENKFRVPVGRKIVDFVDKMIIMFQKDKTLSDVLVSEIRSGIVKGIRAAEKKQGISQYLLNDVKLATLKTLVGWTDDPERFEEIEHSSEKRPKKSTRNGRKKEKGKFVPPQVNLARDLEFVGSDSIRMTLVVSNNYIHPYQNVEIEIDLDPDLVVTKISPFSWVPDQKRIRIGFIEAELGVEPYETIVNLELKMQKRLDEFKIVGRVYYDNCDGGFRAEAVLHETTIKLS